MIRTATAAAAATYAEAPAFGAHGVARLAAAVRAFATVVAGR